MILSHFTTCHVVFWHSIISKNSKTQIHDLSCRILTNPVKV